MSQLAIYEDHQADDPIYNSTNYLEIHAKLAEVGVKFEQWNASIELTSECTNDEVLLAYQVDIDRLKAEGGYQTVDVVSMYPEHPQKDEFRKKFLFEHCHTEDEVRFFVAGKGLFCLHIDQKVFQITCTKNDLISVPANTPHWFDMGSQPSFIAIRLFNNMEGWVAHSTDSDIASIFPLLD